MIRIQDTFEADLHSLFFLDDARTWSVLHLKGNFEAEINTKIVSWSAGGKGCWTSQQEGRRVWGLLKCHVRATRISIHGHQVNES